MAFYACSIVGLEIIRGTAANAVGDGLNLTRTPDCVASLPLHRPILAFVDVRKVLPQAIGAHSV